MLMQGCIIMHAGVHQCCLGALRALRLFVSTVVAVKVTTSLFCVRATPLLDHRSQGEQHHTFFCAPLRSQLGRKTNDTLYQQSFLPALTRLIRTVCDAAL